MQHIVLKIGRYRIALRLNVLQGMMQFCQYHSRNQEACGILLGYEWDLAFEIVVATTPQKSDSRHRYGYVRDVAGHLAAATTLWRNSSGMIGYLGEWHTHPQHIPHPSRKDLLEAMKIARKNEAPILSVILGTTHGCGFMAFGNRTSIVKRFVLHRSAAAESYGDVFLQ